jgi:hypothetical protein
MSRQRTRHRKKKSDDLKGMILIFFVILAVTGFIAVYVSISSSRVERNQATLCRVDGEIPRETALLIDATEGFSPSQSLLISKHMESIIETSLIDEKFTFYALNDNADTFSPLFEICNPGDGSDQNELTANVRRLYQSWETGFKQRITSNVQSLIDENGAESSPILEMLKFVAIQSMFDSAAPQKRLVVVSDLIHNTSEYSQYSEPSRFEHIENSPYLRQVLPDLRNVDVEILYIFRSNLNEIQNRGHIQLFWERLFTEAGGRIISVEAIN